MDTWFAVISCLLYVGQAQSDCVLTDVDIGWNYTLTKKLQPGSLLLYHCNEGYYPYPAIKHQCQHNGKWTPGSDRHQPQRCQIVECPSPILLMNGEVYPPKSTYILGTETSYECYSGYTLRGSSKRVCQKNGKWSGSTPICKEDYGSDDVCPDPGIPPGARRTGNMFGVDDVVSYTCGRDMSLVGSQERKCMENGQWSGIEPTCYYKHTFDTPSEVSHAFGGSIRESLTMLKPIHDADEVRHIRISKNDILNIYIAMDVSESIDDKHFNNTKKAVIRLIDKISSFTVTPNYEIVFFSSIVHQIVDIVTFFEKTPQRYNINNDINSFKIDYSESGTDLSRVFQNFLRQMTLIKMNVGEKKFEEHYHVIIIFTDGGFNMGGSPKPTLAKIKNLVYLTDIPGEHAEAREEHLDVYVFGIGEEVYQDELMPLTLGLGGKHYFRLKDLKALDQTFDKMIDVKDDRSLCGLYRSYSTFDVDDSRKMYPWFAFVIINNKVESKCIGSLVSTKYVLTAAHCFKGDDRPHHVTVEIDDGHSTVKRVKNFILHPNFKIGARKHLNVSEFYDYDVALVELTNEITFSEVVRPICIPCTVQTRDALRLNKTSTCEDQEAVLLGGEIERLSFLTRAKDSNNTFDQELWFSVDFPDQREECINKALLAPGIKTTNVSHAVTKNFLCTGGLIPSTDHIACTGDSGGAVFKQYHYRTIQVGVVSWGTTVLCETGGLKRSESDSRDFHINLFRVIDFLQRILGDNTRNDHPALEFVKKK